MNQFSRKKFLYTAGGSAASAIFLKACGNPPEPGGEATTEEVETADISPEMMPETTQVVLGYIPIVEAALVIAKEKGFFAKYGMTDVELSKQANGASARDNVTIGSGGGGIDRSQWAKSTDVYLSAVKHPRQWNCDRRSETLSSSTRRTGVQMQWSGGLTRCSPRWVEPATQDSRPRLPAVLTPKF